NMASEGVVRSSPDGYTLLLVNAANAINASVYEKLSFEFTRDIAAIASIMRVAFVMVVNPSLPIKTVPELIAYAKANPRNISVGSGGAGGPDQASAEYFKMETGTDMLDVPYRGLGPALADLLGGQVQLVFGTVPAAIEYIKGGKLRPLAVTTATRSQALPDARGGHLGRNESANHSSPSEATNNAAITPALTNRYRRTMIVPPLIIIEHGLG